MSYYMTKKQVKEMFMSEIYPLVIKQYGRDDRIAIREEFNNFVDMLAKDGSISWDQVNKWTNPF